MPATVTFALGGTSISINGPRDSDQASIPRHVMDLSAGGDVWAYKMAAQIKDRWTLNFDFLTGTNKSALLNFFQNVVEGPTTAFSYTHTNGTTYTNCRFASGDPPKFKRRNAEDWATTVVLMVPNQTIT